MIFNKPFVEIDYSDIQNLVDNKVGERQNLEYKEIAWEHNDAGKREMLRDITSVANAFGGYIILGVGENKDGLPIDITDVVDAEKERNRIWSSCISCIDPRIPGFKVKTISTPKKKSLVLIFIPRSTRAPHMITFKGLNQFWIRHDRQKSAMSIEEIREACLRVENLQENVQKFIKERKEELLNKIGEQTTYVIGSVPLGVRNTIVDINDKILREFLKNPPSQRKDGFNLEFPDSISGGRIIPCPTLRGLSIGNIKWKKVELMRNGYYELLVKLEAEHLREKVFNKELYVLKHLPIVEYIISYFRALKMLRQLLGIEETMISYLYIFNIQKYGFVECLRNLSLPELHEVKIYDEPHFEIEPIEIYDFQNPDKIAKEFLDRIWNAFGFESKDVPYFKDNKFEPPGSSK